MTSEGVAPLSGASSRRMHPRKTQDTDSVPCKPDRRRKLSACMASSRGIVGRCAVSPFCSRQKYSSFRRSYQRNPPSHRKKVFSRFPDCHKQIYLRATLALAASSSMSLQPNPGCCRTCQNIHRYSGRLLDRRTRKRSYRVGRTV